MSNIGYAIMGTPNGFQSINVGIIENQRIGKIVDFDNRGMQIFPNSEIFGVIKKIEGSKLYTYYVLYRFASEIERDRTGAFYGSVVVLENNYVDGAIIYTILVELAANVRAYVRPDGKFLTTLDQIDFREPTSLHLLQQSLQPFDSAFDVNPEKEFFNISKGGTVLSFFRSMLDKKAYRDLGSGFASASSQVLAGVKKKDLYPITILNDDYELSIQSLQVENRQLQTELESAKDTMITLHKSLTEEKSRAEDLQVQLNTSSQRIASLRNQQGQYTGTHTSQQGGDVYITSSGRNNNSGCFSRGNIEKGFLGILGVILIGVLAYFLYNGTTPFSSISSSQPNNNNNKSYQQLGNSSSSTNSSLATRTNKPVSTQNSKTDANAYTSAANPKKQNDSKDNLKALKKQAKDLTKKIIDQGYTYADKSVSDLIKEMQAKNLKETSEYKGIMEVYMNWRNTDFAKYQLKNFNTKPVEGRGLDAIVEIVVGKYPYLLECFGREAIKKNLRLFNRVHIQGDDITSSNANLTLWIPRQKYCK